MKKKSFVLCLTKGQATALVAVVALADSENHSVETGNLCRDVVDKIRMGYNFVKDEIVIKITKSQISQIGIILDCLVDETINDAFFDDNEDLFVSYDEDGNKVSMTVKEYFDSRLNSLL